MGAVFIIRFEALLHLLQRVGEFQQLRLYLLLVRPVLLVIDAVLHAGPEVHAQRAYLDLDRVILSQIHIPHRNTQDDMVAAVAVGLRMEDVILLIDNDQVVLPFQRIDHLVSVLLEIADHTHTGNVLQMCAGISRCRVEVQPFQFFIEAFMLFDSGVEGMDRLACRVLVDGVVQDVKPAKQQIQGILIG